MTVEAKTDRPNGTIMDPRFGRCSATFFALDREFRSRKAVFNLLRSLPLGTWVDVAVADDCDPGNPYQIGEVRIT